MVASIYESDALNLGTVEAATILKGLQQCIHLGITHLVIESDCQVVVNKLQNEDPLYLTLKTYYPLQQK